MNKLIVKVKAEWGSDIAGSLEYEILKLTEKAILVRFGIGCDAWIFRRLLDKNDGDEFVITIPKSRVEVHDGELPRRKQRGFLVRRGA